MNKNDLRTISDKYFPAKVVDDDGTVRAMSDSDRDLYLNELSLISILERGKIISMRLKKEKGIVYFNGLVCWNDKQGGFSISGEILKNRIIMNIYWKNTDTCEKVVIDRNELCKKKGL